MFDGLPKRKPWMDPAKEAIIMASSNLFRGGGTAKNSVEVHFRMLPLILTVLNRDANRRGTGDHPKVHSFCPCAPEPKQMPQSLKPVPNP